MHTAWREGLAGALAGLLLVAAGAGARGQGVPADAAPAPAPQGAVGVAQAAVAGPPCARVEQPVLRSAAPPPWQAQLQPAEAQARQAALAQVVTLLQSMPTYPGARPVGSSPYGMEKVDAEGRVAPDGAPLQAAGEPMTPDLVDVFRVWRVPGDAFAAVDLVNKWAQSHGWSWLGSGQGHGPQPADDTASRTFAAPGTHGADGTPQIQVVAARDGYVRYDALVVVVPPRPAGESVPAGATEAVVTACNGLPEGQVAQTTVSDPDTVAALAAAVNGLRRTTAVVVFCAYDSGFRVFIDFRYAEGRSVEIMDFPACWSATFVGPDRWPGLSDQGLAAGIEAATDWDLRQVTRSSTAPGPSA